MPSGLEGNAIRLAASICALSPVSTDGARFFVKGPKFSRQIGITPILEAEQVRELLNSIEGDTVKGLRDRAAIAVMAYTFARVSAVAGLRRGDYTLEGKRARLRLHEKGGKEKLVWLHREAEEYLDAYLRLTGISDPKLPSSRRSIRRTV